MPSIIRTLLLVLSGLVLTLFFAIGLSPIPAIAPTDQQPARLTPSTATSTHTATSSSQSTDNTALTVKIEQVPEPKPSPAPSPKPVPASTPTPPVKPDVQQKIIETVDSINKTLADLSAQQALNNVPTDYKVLNETVRSTIVNIICTTEGAGPFNPISASGVMINPRGVIMTNAHVAQYFLLKNYPSPNFVTCIIRAGSPAVATYTAELMFLPPSWIELNAQKIIQENPTGNGDHDYALLRVTGSTIIGKDLPSTFPYLPVSPEPPIQFAEVLIAGYPAGFLGGITILKDLFAASSIARVGELYTFGGNTLDLFSIGGSIVAQQGSSGGAVTDRSGNLIGVIVTSSEGADTSSRDLRALATSYIERDFVRESGKSFTEFLNGNLADEADSFRVTIAPTLTQSLVNAIERK